MHSDRQVNKVSPVSTSPTTEGAGCRNGLIGRRTAKASAARQKGLAAHARGTSSRCVVYRESPNQHGRNSLPQYRL